MLETIEQWTDEAFLEETKVAGYMLDRYELRARYAEIYFKLQAVRIWLEYDKFLEGEFSSESMVFEISVPMLGQDLQALQNGFMSEEGLKNLYYMFGGINKRNGIFERVYILLLENIGFLYGDNDENGKEIWLILEQEINRLENGSNLTLDQECLNELKRLLKSVWKKNCSKKKFWSEQIIRALDELQMVLEQVPDIIRYKTGKYYLNSTNGRKLLELYEWLLERESPLWRGALKMELPEVPSGKKQFVPLFGYIAKFMKDTIKKQSGQDKERVALLILDDVEAGLHPKQQQRLIVELADFLEYAFPAYRFQILMTTDSPIFLSDLTAERVLRVAEDDENPENIVTEQEELSTFGGNLYDLFCKGFSMSDGTTGLFAQKKINMAIRTARHRGERQEIDAGELLYIIDSLGEPLTKDYINEIWGAYGKEYRKSDEWK